jgi:class 3 adenylate cyclase
MKKSVIVRDLDQIIQITSELNKIAKIQTRKPLETVAIFDLSNSTDLKLKIGHDDAIRKIFFHNQLCRQIIKRFNGHVVKDMGDGLLAKFQDPLYACMSAINIQIATQKCEVPSKTALALGVIEEAIINKDVDIFGSTVDLCSRIEKCAFPNQILTDRSLFDVVKTHLKDYSDIIVGDTMYADLKGFGKCEIYEISSERFGLINSLKNSD